MAIDAAPGDLYAYVHLLPDREQDVLARVRDFLDREVRPIADECWRTAEFPHHLVPRYADLGIAGLPYDECPGEPVSALLTGFITLEMGRADPSMATFWGVHSGLAMGTVAACGSTEQRSRWLPAMARMEQVGAFALTEPEHGSDVAGGLATTARRDGDEWVLDGAKRWIGNATFADLVVVWARDVADGEVKGFVVERGTPGFTATRIEHKIALRTVQNADIVLDGARVPEANRLQRADSFADTAGILRRTRSGVAWHAVGIMLASYELALRYAGEREQFGGPIARFQLVQDLLVRILGDATAGLGMLVQLARVQDSGQFRDEHSALAKAWCTTRMRDVVGWAREIHGGNGVDLAYSIGRYVADAEAIYSYEGTREINSLVVGRAVTGHGAFV
jgi:glutaryl-CoA dehydrogenase